MRRAVLVACIFLFPVICRAEGLGTLIETGNNMAEIAREHSDQTARFEQVRRAVESGALAKGASLDEVIISFGEPVIQNTRYGYRP